MSERSGIMEAITGIAVKLFSKTTLVHELYVHKNNLKVCFGVKVKKLFSAIVTVKSQEKVTIVTLNLNGYKYRVYLATGKILTAIRMTLLYIKGKLTKDARLLRKLNAITINKKEYKQMKLNKKKIVKAIKDKAKSVKNKPDTKKEPAKPVVGPLIIKLGYEGESPKFDEAKAIA